MRDIVFLCVIIDNRASKSGVTVCSKEKISITTNVGAREYHSESSFNWSFTCLLSPQAHYQTITNLPALCSFSLCLFSLWFSSSLSPSLLSCLFDSAKFRAVTLNEGFLAAQHCCGGLTGPADPLPREPWPHSSEIAADDLRCCWASCACVFMRALLRCCACVSLSPAWPSLLQVLQVYKHVISVLGQEASLRSTRFHFSRYLFLLHPSRYLVACELQQQTWTVLVIVPKL